MDILLIKTLPKSYKIVAYDDTILLQSKLKTFKFEQCQIVRV